MPYGTHDPASAFVERLVNRFQVKLDVDWSIRECRLYLLKMIMNGTIYDNLVPWHEEFKGTQSNASYTPLSGRRPSVIYRLPLIIVNESVAMLFGDEHFPAFRSENEPLVEFIDYINDVSCLQTAMIKAAYIGALGSVCVVLKVLAGKFYLDVLETYCLEPTFDPMNPSVLINLCETRKYDGATLRSYGYSISDEDKKEMFFLVREWTETAEFYYMPFKVAEKDGHTLVQDNERSAAHDLGFVPAIWCKNTSTTSACHIDGLCTFEGAIDTFFEIDYQLSQLGRLLKYNSDPTLVIKNPSSLEGNQLIKGVGALNLDEKGDAYLLEMTNSSTTAVIDYVRSLREYSLEVLRGNRANPEKINAVQSGRALQMLNSSLISLVGEMRISYGTELLLPIYKMMLDIIKTGKYELKLAKLPPEDLDESDMELDWPHWYVQTPQDDVQEAQTLLTLTTGNIITRETATKTVADQYKIMDIKKELREIDRDTENMQNDDIKTNNLTKKQKVNVRNDK